jgi:hypothetical protein
MFLLVQAPRFSTVEPGLLNSDGELTVSLPILNIGTADASNIRVTSISLGSAVRLSPQGLPLFVGNLGTHNTTSIAARFSLSGLSVGGRYLMMVQGTYETNNATYGFAVNRYIVVPPPSPPPVVFLKAHVDVAVEPGIWTYTIFNNEPADSPQFVATFSIEVVAPFTVTGVPEGWEMETDNVSYVLWVAADQQLPYPHQIAPGGSLGGFQIQSSSSGSESTAYVVTAWNHVSDQAGLVSPDVVLSPSRLV